MGRRHDETAEDEVAARTHDDVLEDDIDDPSVELDNDIIANPAPPATEEYIELELERARFV